VASGFRRRYPSSTDVARVAGVSQATVSRAYAAGGRISATTRLKVEAAAKALGYSPNLIPRIMREDRSRLVAVVIAGSDNPFYSSVLEAFTTALQETGHQVLLVHVESEHALDGVLPRLASYRIDGIVSALPVISRATASQLARLRIPTVSFNTPVNNRFVSAVCTDNAGGAAAIADLFVTCGCRTFGYVGGPADSHAGNERWRGYRGRLEALGFRDIRQMEGDFTYPGGARAALALHAGGGLPQGLFCGNDLTAMGALDAIRHALGRRVPEDHMLAGFDDIPQAAWTAYDLTTILQDGKAMVAAAAEILQARMIEPGKAISIERIVPGRLVERATTRRLR
jgi:DNA-binding LacI/PurR family transcriptional regulator